MKKITSLLVISISTFFSAFSQHTRSIENIGIGEVSVIELGANGDSWVGSNGQGVAFFNNATQSWTYFNKTNTPQLKSDTITSIVIRLIAGVQHTFIGTTQGVAYTNGSGGITWDTLAEVAKKSVKGLVYRADSLWVLTDSNVVRYDSSRVFKQSSVAPILPMTVAQRGASQCGGFCTGTANNGCFYTTDGVNYSYIDTSAAHWKMVDNRVNALTFDNACIARLVGTKGGFSICPKGVPCQNFTTADGLPENDITAVAVGCDGKIWLGTRDSGVVVYNNPGFVRITTHDGLPNNKITAITFTPGACTASVGMKDGNVAVVDSNRTVVKVLSGVENVTKENFSVQIFPQPASNQINFLFGNEITDGDLNLMDINGRLIQHLSLKNTSHILADVSALSDGIYFYQIISAHQLMKAGKVSVMR